MPDSLKDEQATAPDFLKSFDIKIDSTTFDSDHLALMQALEFEKRRLTDVFERAPAFMAILHGPDHVYEMVNSAYYQVVGHRNIIGKPLREAIPEVNGQGFIEILDGVLAHGVPFVGTEMKIQLQREPNVASEPRYLNFVYAPLNDLYGQRTGIVAHGYDITDQVVARQSAERLAEQVEQQARTFDATLKALKDFVYTFDRKGRFTYANAPLLDLLGLSLPDIIGHTFHEL